MLRNFNKLLSVPNWGFHYGENMEYKVVVYQEGMLGSLLLGGSKVNPVKFTDFLNQNSENGWRVQTMEKDIRRMLLFWKREAYVVILGREK